MPYELARPEAPLTRQVKGKYLRGLSVGVLALLHNATKTQGQDASAIFDKNRLAQRC